MTYLGLAIALAFVAVMVWIRRNSLVEAHAGSTSIWRAFELLGPPRFALGALCIFLYVGGEVAIGSMIVNYLMLPACWDGRGSRREERAAYLGGAIVGRFAGAYLLRVFSPGR